MVQDIEKSGAAVEPPTLRPILAYLPSMFRRFWLSETALCSELGLQLSAFKLRFSQSPEMPDRLSWRDRLCGCHNRIGINSIVAV